MYVVIKIDWEHSCEEFWDNAEQYMDYEHHDTLKLLRRSSEARMSQADSERFLSAMRDVPGFSVECSPVVVN